MTSSIILITLLTSFIVGIASVIVMEIKDVKLSSLSLDITFTLIILCILTLVFNGFFNY